GLGPGARLRARPRGQVAARPDPTLRSAGLCDSRGLMHMGVVGAGRIGAFHARTLASLPEVGRVTIADVEPGRGDVATADELLASGVEALVIATPTIAHAPLLRLAAAAGL